MNHPPRCNSPLRMRENQETSSPSRSVERCRSRSRLRPRRNGHQESESKWDFGSQETSARTREHDYNYRRGVTGNAREKTDQDGDNRGNEYGSGGDARKELNAHQDGTGMQSNNLSDIYCPEFVRPFKPLPASDTWDPKTGDANVYITGVKKSEVLPVEKISGFVHDEEGRQALVERKMPDILQYGKARAYWILRTHLATSDKFCPHPTDSETGLVKAELNQPPFYRNRSHKVSNLSTSVTVKGLTLNDNHLFVVPLFWDRSLVKRTVFVKAHLQQYQLELLPKYHLIHNPKVFARAHDLVAAAVRSQQL
jgi:hypothetical protein